MAKTQAMAICHRCLKAQMAALLRKCPKALTVPILHRCLTAHSPRAARIARAVETKAIKAATAIKNLTFA